MNVEIKISFNINNYILILKYNMKKVMKEMKLVISILNMNMLLLLLVVDGDKKMIIVINIET